MRPELQRLADELTEVRAAISAVDDASRTAANGWTVAQVLEHLTKAHVLTVPRLDAALASAPRRVGDDPVRYSFLERRIVKTMAGKGMKIPVPAMFEPGDAGPESKAACLDSIDALLSTILRADERALAALKVASPVGERFRMGLLPYLDGMVQHARYHRGQISS